MHKVLAAVVLAILILTGCTPKIIYVKQTEYKAVEVNTQLLETKRLPPPPEKKEFLASSPPVQRNMLADYSVRLQTLVEQLNKQITEIDQVLFKHNQRVVELNEKNKEK